MSVQNSSGLADYPVPVGTIFPYCGAVSTISSKFRVCDGANIPKADFPNLYEMLGDFWTSVSDLTDFPNNFSIPNLTSFYPSPVATNVGLQPTNPSVGNTGTATIDFPIAVSNLPPFTLSETTGTGDTLQGTWTDLSPNLGAGVEPIFVVDRTGASATPSNGPLPLPVNSAALQAQVQTTTDAEWSHDNPAQTNVDTTLTLTSLKPPRYEMIFLIKTGY